jgi:hypothetical protein
MRKSFTEHHIADAGQRGGGTGLMGHDLGFRSNTAAITSIGSLDAHHRDNRSGAGRNKGFQ